MKSDTIVRKKMLKELILCLILFNYGIGPLQSFTFNELISANKKNTCHYNNRKYTFLKTTAKFKILFRSLKYLSRPIGILMLNFNCQK